MDNKQWKDLVFSVQHRLDSGDEIYYDDILILRQNIEYDGLMRNIAHLTYWNDYLWTKAFVAAGANTWDIAKIQIDEEKKHD